MNSLTYLLPALSFVVLAHSYSFYQCPPCKGEECNVQPEDCLYDTYLHPCGQWKCMSGPGQRCGGRDNHLGKCGNGMTCHCNKCKGCSTDVFLQRGIWDCSKNTLPICD